MTLFWLTDSSIYTLETHNHKGRDDQIWISSPIVSSAPQNYISFDPTRHVHLDGPYMPQTLRLTLTSPTSQSNASFCAHLSEQQQHCPSKPDIFEGTRIDPLVSLGTLLPPFSFLLYFMLWKCWALLCDSPNTSPSLFLLSFLSLECYVQFVSLAHPTQFSNLTSTVTPPPWHIPRPKTVFLLCLSMDKTLQNY